MNMDWNEIASSYNSIRDARLTTVFPAVRRVLQDLSATNILDFGCGDGKFSMAYAGSDVHVVNYI